MAHLDSISLDSVQKVADAVARLIDEKMRKPEPTFKERTESLAPLRIGESLTLWKFKADAFKALWESRLSGDLSEWVEQAPFLHHQLRFGTSSAGFVRSY